MITETLRQRQAGRQLGERGATFPSSGRRIDYTLLNRGVALSSSVETGGDLSDHDAVVSRVVVNTNGITGALK